jgi:hypothetical protein
VGELLTALPVHVERSRKSDVSGRRQRRRDSEGEQDRDLVDAQACMSVLDGPSGGRGGRGRGGIASVRVLQRSGWCEVGSVRVGGEKRLMLYDGW